MVLNKYGIKFVVDLEVDEMINFILRVPFKEIECKEIEELQEKEDEFFLVYFGQETNEMFTNAFA